MRPKLTTGRPPGDPWDGKGAYVLAPGMRARKESFGLLFYNTRNAKLTFVRSRELLHLAADPIQGSFVLSRARGRGEAAKARRFLDALQDKGILLGRSFTSAR